MLRLISVFVVFAAIPSAAIATPNCPPCKVPWSGPGWYHVVDDLGGPIFTASGPYATESECTASLPPAGADGYRFDDENNSHDCRYLSNNRWNW